MSQQHGLAPKKAFALLGCMRSAASSLRVLILHFCSALVTAGFLSLVLSFPAQKRHGHVGKSLWRAMKGIKGLVYLMEGKTARAVTIEPGEWGRLRENNFRNM